MTVEAISWLRSIGFGDTRPQVFECESRGEIQQWVLKLTGASPAELAADWIGTLLARRAGLRCPESDIADVTTGALANAPADIQEWARPGPAFASRLLRANSGLIDAQVVQFTADELGAMYAVDTWLEVLDRRRPDGIWNVMEGLQSGELWVLDFGKSLAPCLVPLVIAGDEIVEPNYPSVVRRKASVSSAMATCDIIESLTAEEIAEVVVSAPARWISDAERRCVVRFLAGRAARVRQVCQRSLGGGAV